MTWLSGFRAALSSDVYLAMRSRWLRVVVLAPGLAAAGSVFLERLRATREAAQDALLGSATAAASTGSERGYGALVGGLSAGLTVASIVLLAVAAHSIASERERGLVRHLLVRRVSRSGYVAAKYVFLLLLSFAVVAIVGLGASGAAAAVYELGPVVEDGYEIIGVAEMQSEITRGVALALAPLPAALALGLFLSLAARSTTMAVSVALALALGFDLLKGSLGEISRYVYAFHQPSLIDTSWLKEVGQLVRGFSDVFVEDEVLFLNAVVPWPAALLFFVAALLLGSRREM